MKKLLSILLVIIMLLSLAPASLASEEAEPVPEEAEAEILPAEEIIEEPAEEIIEEPIEEPAEAPAQDGATSGKCGDNLIWRLKDGVLTISGTGNMTDYDYTDSGPWHSEYESITSIVVEDGVTSIGEYAFRWLYKATGVRLPNTLRRIGLRSFMDCKSLASVTIPESVTAIETEAFDSCSSLTSVAIPAGVTYIGGSPFSNCEKLQAIYVDAGNERYAAVDGVLFSKDKTQLICYPEGKSGLSYTIPSGVTRIGFSAFKFNWVLESVTIPDSVTAIDSSAFHACESLTSITIPKGVSKIAFYAFYYCSSLSQIVFEGDAPNIDSEAFSEVTATAYYPAGNSTWTDAVKKDYGGALAWIGLETFSVSFNTAYGSAPATQYVLPGKTAYEPAAPTDPIGKYEFRYWQILKYVTISGHNIPIPIEYDFSTTVNEDIGLIAKWEKRADILLGDVNNDGKVNPADRAALARYLANWPEYQNINLANADVNDDDKVNPADRAYLARHFANWPEYATLGMPVT